MKTKLKVWALSLALMGSLASFAQQNNKAAPKEEKKEKQAAKPKRTPEQVAEQQTQRMTNQLALTEAQKKPVYDIMLERAKQRVADREACKGEKECASAAMRKRNMAADAKLKAVLTPEQYEKLKALRAAARENKGKGGKGGKGSKGAKGEKDVKPSEPVDKGAPDDEEKD